MYYGVTRKSTTISSVTAPASSYDLTDLPTIRDELQIADSDNSSDSALSRYITACSMAIQAYCNRNFAVETIQDSFFPQRDAPVSPVQAGIDDLQLSRWPLVSITSIVENSIALVENIDFIGDYATGALTRLDINGLPMRWSTLPVVAVYVAGEAPPPDVVDAAIEFVKFRYFARMRDPGLKSENVAGVYEATYLWGTGPGGPDDIPAPVFAKINRYRVPVVA